MLRHLRNTVRRQKSCQIKDIIYNQNILEKAFDERLALAGIDKTKIPYHLKERIILLPQGRIHCVGAGTTITLDRDHFIYRCADDLTINDKDQTIIKSKQAIIEESIKDNKIGVWYAV